MDSVSGIVVAGCLAVFAAVNLDNLLRYRRRRSVGPRKPEIERQIASPLLLAGAGSFAFFLESFLYVLLDYSGNSLFAFLDFGGMRMRLLEPFGWFIMVLGYGIFIWSVLARGRYATSWQMPADHQLVDWGPYRYVRHPSYLGYFLMFIGFVLMWQNIIALIPLVAIPGYVLITRREDEMLVVKFGEKYLQYKNRVGGFLPRMARSKSR